MNKCIDCNNDCTGKLRCQKCFLRWHNIDHHPMKGKHHSEETKKKIGAANSIANKGRKSWNKGLHYKKQKCWSQINCKGCMNKFNAVNWEKRVYCSKDCEMKSRNFSKPQEQLFEYVKELFKDYNIFYEYKITTNNKNKYLDIAIPELKLNFEYDGEYYHKDKIKDKERDLLLTSQGWSIFRYNKDNLSEINLKNDIKNIYGGILPWSR